MNKTQLAIEDLSARQLSSAIREIDWPIPDELPITDLVQLFIQVENGLSDYGGVVAQFMTVTAGCGGELIALDMAWAAAAVLGRDILVLNATTALDDMRRGVFQRDNGGGDALVRPLSLEAHMVKVIGHGLYVVDLRESCSGARPLAMTDEIVAGLRKLAPRFDMIVVATPPTDADPLATALAHHVDGNLLVVEAEQTSRAQAFQMRQILARCGRPLLGAILNNRRRHMPGWLARQ